MIVDLLDPRLWLTVLASWYIYLAWWKKKQTVFELISVAAVVGGCVAIAGFRAAALYVAFGIWSLIRKK